MSNLTLIDSNTGFTNLQSRDMHQGIMEAMTINSIIQFYTQANEDAGGVIIFDPHRSCIPYLQGSDGSVILLYKFVEVLEDIIDYDRISEEFPSLSFGQIFGAIDFLRKLAQFNTKSMDVDSYEERFIEDNSSFQAAIIESLKNQEQLRVLATE